MYVELKWGPVKVPRDDPLAGRLPRAACPLGDDRRPRLLFCGPVAE